MGKRRSTGSARHGPWQEKRPSAQRSGRHRNWPHALALLLAWGLIIGAVVCFHWLSGLPDTKDLLAKNLSRDITILDVKGRLIARRGLTQSRNVDVSRLPSYVPDAFIAIEDRRFRDHIGLDFFGLLRAAGEDLAAGRVVQGGSTLTQQLAKNLFLAPARTFERKGQEAMLALYLESRYSKDQILTLYLNHVYFGAGAYGVEAAAERFFGKPAEKLTLKEAAMLAGSVKAPARFNPLTDADASEERARTVLEAMQTAGFISARAEADADSTRPRIAHVSGTPDSGYFADWIVAHVPGLVGDVGEPLIVQTTLDIDAQTNAERALKSGLDREGHTLRASEGALVALAPDGAIRAMVGGSSYSKSPFNRAADASRQPGSAFKPFVYLAALEHGRSPDDVAKDAPVNINGWKPNDYEGRFEGEITLRRAFAKSSNSVAAQLGAEVGPQAVAEVAHRLGIASPLSAVPSLALGTSSVTLLELTGAYSPLANGGRGTIPYGIARIRTSKGRTLYEHKSLSAEQVVSPANAASMAEMMVETVTSGTGRAAKLDNYPSAGKTGTTQDSRDAWFVGFTADMICGVWIGNDDNAPMAHATGGGLPAHVFKSFMQSAQAGLPPRPLTALAGQSDGTTPQTDPSSEQPDAIERLLNSLFNGT